MEDEPRRFDDDFGATFWGGTLYELAPGEAFPSDRQAGEEEVCVVVTGRPTVRTPAGDRELRPWDIAWFVRGDAGARRLHNDTGEPARVVFFSTVQRP